MSANVEAIDGVGTTGEMTTHPRGLYVLFATEMWERFSFYSMLAMFTLYLQDNKKASAGLPPRRRRFTPIT
jgi:dipeptide/tripeptide permease